VEEVLTVRDGAAEMWLDDERIQLSAGQCLIVPAGCRHGFRNPGATILHVHAVLASPIFEAMMEGATEPTRRWEASPERAHAG
jgi:mannose-6-phosphate isomerase-like protein (cupin superfamily)